MLYDLWKRCLSWLLGESEALYYCKHTHIHIHSCDLDIVIIYFSEHCMDTFISLPNPSHTLISQACHLRLFLRKHHLDIQWSPYSSMKPHAEQGGQSSFNLRTTIPLQGPRCRSKMCWIIASRSAGVKRLVASKPGS